jgi:hypothetical protein
MINGNRLPLAVYILKNNSGELYLYRVVGVLPGLNYTEINLNIMPLKYLIKEDFKKAAKYPYQRKLIEWWICE